MTVCRMVKRGAYGKAVRGMSPAAAKKMREKRYGKSGKKPTKKQLQASYDRQKPAEAVAPVVVREYDPVVDIWREP